MIRTFNEIDIRGVLDHEDIKPNISDSNEPYHLPLDDSIHYLYEEGALFIFHPFKDGHEVHVNIIKGKRYKALDLGFEAIEYAKKLGTKFYTHVPKEYPNVRDYTLKLGLEMTDKGDHWQFYKEFE